MGRSPCCDKVGLKKGPWTPEEDQKLLAYIEEHGHGSWRALPSKAGLQRCGKSCRLRWTNYLRPDIKRGKFSIQEEQTIIQLHALLGNRWSAIATHLPKRTDNEIKNYWNTHLKKRLAKMGIDPVTHKPKSDAILSTDGQSKHAANLSHMAQWESARLEAEARLVRQSKLRSTSLHGQNLIVSPEFSAPSSPLSLSKPVAVAPPGPPRCLDILKAWNGVWTKPNDAGGSGLCGDLESPTSTLSYSENNAPQMSSTNRMGESSAAFIEFVGNNSSGSYDDRIMKEDGEENWKGFGSTSRIENSMSLTSGLQDLTMPMDNSAAWHGDFLRPENPDDDEDDDHAAPRSGVGGGNFVERFTDLLLSNAPGAVDRSFSEGCGESENGAAVTTAAAAGPGSEYLEDNKNYWNSILNLVNSSPPHSPMF